MLLNCGVGEDSLQSPLDCKEMKSVNPKGNQAWKFTGRTDAEVEAPILWPLIRRTDSLEKTLMMEKDWRQEERGWQRIRWLDGWHHQLNWHEFKQALGVGHGQGSLACCSTWGLKELDMTKWLNWTEAFPFYFFPLFLCIVPFIFIFNINLFILIGG